MKHLKKIGKLGLISGLLLTSIGVQAKTTWVETVYSLTEHFGQHQSWPGFHATANHAYNNFFVAIPNHFYCTGSTNTAPMWRMLFSALCINDWNYGNSWSHTWTSDGTVSYDEQYYTRTGTNNFEEDESSASRSIDERVSDIANWVFTPDPG